MGFSRTVTALFIASWKDSGNIFTLKPKMKPWSHENARLRNKLDRNAEIIYISRNRFHAIPIH